MTNLAKTDLAKLSNLSAIIERLSIIINQNNNTRFSKETVRGLRNKLLSFEKQFVDIVLSTLDTPVTTVSESVTNIHPVTAIKSNVEVTNLTPTQQVFVVTQPTSELEKPVTILQELSAERKALSKVKRKAT